MPLGDWLHDQDANKFNNSYFRDANDTGFAVDMSGDLVVRGRVGIGTSNPPTLLSLGYNLAADGSYNTGTRDLLQFQSYRHNGGFAIRNNDDNTYAKIEYIYSNWNNNHPTYGTSDGQQEVNTSVMTLRHDGNVGIGTTNPNCPLEVRKGVQGQLGSGGTRLNRFNYNSTSFTSFETNVGITDVTVWAHGNMGCLGSIFSHNGGLVASDVRIKTNITDVQDGEALSLLRSLKPKTYSYKDVINRGTNSVYGFIAQEVGETISMSTFTRKETIPNIYQLATVGTDKKTICFYQGFNTNDLDSSSNILQITGVNDEEHFVNIEEIIDASYIRVNTDLSDMMGDVDDSGNIIEGTKVFVYGQQVDDFTFLKKEAIWTVATAALQEVDRQLQAEKAKTATLESQVAALLTRVTALENA